MIVLAWFKGGKVNVNVPNGSLVYDGREFVDPAKAANVALVYAEMATASRPSAYPIERFNSPENQLTWQNLWVCKVIQVLNPADAMPTDVVTAPPPVDGMCVCGITCDGVNVQNVVVTNP